MSAFAEDLQSLPKMHVLKNVFPATEDPPYAIVLTLHFASCMPTIRYRMARDLGKQDWLRAARLALLRGGVDAVRVERLARDLHVTKGSFYWHFKDREELLELLLREWEQELSRDIVPRLRGRRGKLGLLSLVRLLVKRVPLGEEGILPSDAAVFAWAAMSPEVAQRVNRAERERIRLLKHIIGNSHLVEMLYLVWLGFVAQGQRVPGSRKAFPRIASMMLELSSSATRNRPRRAPISE